MGLALWTFLGPKFKKGPSKIRQESGSLLDNMSKPSFFTTLRSKNQIQFVRDSSLSKGKSLSNESMKVQYFGGFI